VAIYAQPRATKDLDILVKADPENAKAVFAALAEFGAPLKGLTSADFEEPGPFFRIGREPVGVDILTAIPGVEFDTAWQRRVEDVFDEQTNLRATFISREDPLGAKRAAGRRQDLADIEAIEKAAQSQRPKLKKKVPRKRALGGPSTVKSTGASRVESRSTVTQPSQAVLERFEISRFNGLSEASVQPRRRPEAVARAKLCQKPEAHL
jgi:hypothetical protein